MNVFDPFDFQNAKKSDVILLFMKDVRSRLLRFPSDERSKWLNTFFFLEYNKDQTQTFSTCLVVLHSYRAKKKAMLVQHPPLTASALQLLVYSTACGAQSPLIPPQVC